jgi:peptide/nickel transport system permease protein
MFDTLVRRLSQSVAVIAVMSVIAFAGIHLVGDPIHLLVSPTATPAEIADASRAMGLDRPLPEQYWRFVTGALHGDLGHSFVFNRPALELIVERLPATLELALLALLLSAGIGIPLGLAAGLKPSGRRARLILGASIVGVTLPTFWVGLILILVFSVNLGWLPSGGRGPTTELLGMAVSFTSWGGMRHLLLPALTLSLFKIALVIRLTEAGTREVATQEYVKFARAKGVTGARLLLRHIAPNVMIPVVTALGLEFGQLLAFSVITETIFAWPGMGKLIIDSILHLDRPVVVAYLLVTLLIFVLVNLLVDVLYVLLDPRLRTRASA